MPSAIDPTFPADGTPVSKPAFRDQLLTLRAELDHGGFVTNPVTLAESTASQALADLHAAMPASRVGTIAELQAIPPAPGLVVEVLGYQVPGDGGGGLFYADMTGARQTDGGIVFGHTGDESPEQTDPGHLKEQFADGFALPHTDLVWGSVVVDPDGPSPHVFSDIELHGHRSGTGGYDLVPLVDHGTGTFPADGTGRLRNHLQNYAPSTASVRYKHFTAARRWVRVHDGRVLDVRWFGVTDDGSDQRDRIAWALNAAKRLGFREVRLNGSYRYLGAIEIPDGIDFGWGKLTVVDGLALEHLRTDFATAYPDNTISAILNNDATCLFPANDSSSIGLRALELDGNYQNNTAPLENEANYARGDGLQSTLQNTPLWGGFFCTVHGGRVIPELQKVVLTDVHIHGFGSNCLLGDGNTTFSSRNVRLGNSARNHLFYSIHGDFVGLTCYGFAWGSYGKTEHCNFYGLRFEDLRDFPFTPSWTLAPNLILFEGMGWRSAVETYHRWHRHGSAIIGGHWELENWPGTGPLMSGDGHHLTLQDIVVLGPVIGSGEIPFLAKGTTEAMLIQDWTVRNVTMLNRSGSRLGLLGFSDPNAVIFSAENVSVSYLQGYESTGQLPSWARVYAGPPMNGLSASYPRRIAFNRITSNLSGTFLQLDIADPAATPVEVTVRDSTLRFRDAKIVRSSNSGTGTIAGLTLQDLSKVKMFFDTTRFEFQAGGESFDEAELFFALTRFRGCTTFDGLVSEQQGTVAATGTWAAVPTALLWAPEVVRVLPMNGGLTDLWFEVYDSTNTTPIANVADKRSPTLRIHHSGSSGTLAWEAAVRPF